MALLQIADPEAEAGPVFAGEGSLLPILVLYNRGLRDSSTYRTFCASARACGWDSSRIAVYDNSRIRQVSHEEETRLQAYRHDPANGGLAAAYNWALEIALTRKDSWILLLDQDSTMPLCFLATLWKAMRLFSTDERVAAIVPYAMDGSSRVSPKRVRFGRMADLNVPTPSVADQEIMAINSGTALRASFIERLNGFNSAYKLDFLDHWLFRKIHASGMRVVLSGSVLEHNLAASDYRTNINTSRYYSIIASEVRFMRTEKQSLELPVYVGRLLLRSVKQLIVYRRRELAAITLSVAVKLLIRRSGPNDNGKRSGCPSDSFECCIRAGTWGGRFRKVHSYGDFISRDLQQTGITWRPLVVMPSLLVSDTVSSGAAHKPSLCSAAIPFCSVCGA